MTKLTKISLVTAVALMGISSTACGASIADKLTFKGEISYTMEQNLKDDVDHKEEAQHDIDVRVQADFKVNDNFTVTARLDELNDDDTDANPNEFTTEEKTVKDKDGKDVKIKIPAESKTKNSSALQPEIDQVYVTYKKDALKSMVGLQKISAPRLHDSANGDGAIVEYKLSDAAVLNGGYFYTTEMTSSEVSGGKQALLTDNIVSLGLNGKIDIVNYGLTYAMIKDSSKSTTNDGTEKDNGAKIVDALVGVNLGFASLELANTSKSYDAVVGTGKDQKLTKATLKGKAGDVNYSLAYAVTGKDGGEVSLDNQDDAPVHLLLNSVSTYNFIDAKAIYASVGSKFADDYTAKFEYMTIESDIVTGEATNFKDYKEAKEYQLKIENNIDKNFTVWVNYNDYEITKLDGAAMKDAVALTLGAKYTF